MRSVINKFLLPENSNNLCYTCLDSPNEAAIYPFVKLSDGKIAIFQEYTATGSLYHSPAYWMRADQTYKNKAATNRGRFTEEIVLKLVSRAIRPGQIFRNVIFKSSKKFTDGEADIMFVHGKRAFIWQLKSKGLSELARAGNELAISQDFAYAFQGAYNQAASCIDLLNRKVPAYSNGELLDLAEFEAVENWYPICVTSEHYPYLSFQVRQFLKLENRSGLNHPIVMDIFTLDVATEFLRSPLYFVDYLAKRSTLYEKIISSHELVTLAYHLRGNLFVPDDIHMMMVEDDFMIELDLAMNVRRRGVPGSDTPGGLLTRDLANPLGRILTVADDSERGDVHQLGEFILNLSSESWTNINRWLSGMVAQTKADAKNHDVTVPLAGAGIGMTVHCNDHDDQDAFTALASHCEMRKYVHKADRWFGVCLGSSGEVRFALGRIGPWHFDPILEPEAQTLKVRSANHWVGTTGRRPKLGRNDSCPCGSGKKYKKCCLN